MIFLLRSYPWALYNLNNKSKKGQIVTEDNFARMRISVNIMYT